MAEALSGGVSSARSSLLILGVWPLNRSRENAGAMIASTETPPHHAAHDQSLTASIHALESVLVAAAWRAPPQSATKKSNKMEFTVYTKRPPDWREEKRCAQDRKPKHGKPVASFLGATVDPEGTGMSKLQTFFKSLGQSKKIGDPDIMMPFANRVRENINTRDKSEGFQRALLFVFLSYAAVLETRLGRYAGKEALEDAMRTALGTKDADGIEKDLGLDYLKSLRTGGMQLHQVINRLVAKAWPPARATFAVISRAYLRPWEYDKLNATHVDLIVNDLLKTDPTDVGDGHKHAICIADELVKLDSMLSRDTTHEDLGYMFECTTCRPPDLSSDNVTAPFLHASQVGNAATVAASLQNTTLLLSQRLLTEGETTHYPSRSMDIGSVLNTDQDVGRVTYVSPAHTDGDQRIDNAETQARFASQLAGTRAETVSTMVLQDDRRYLLMMAHSLGGSLCEPLLQRLSSERWNDDGELIVISAADARLSQQLLEILQDQDRLAHALHPFDESLILTNVQLERCRADAASLAKSGHDVLRMLRIAALEWVCFAMPRTKRDGLQYRSLVRVLFPLLEHAVEGVEDIVLAAPTRCETAEALLAAAKYAGYRQRALALLRPHMVKDTPEQIRADLAVEHSMHQRLVGNYAASDRIIHDFCCGCANPMEGCLRPAAFRCAAWKGGKLRAMYSLLQRSYVENLVQSERYKLAVDQVQDWQWPTSTLEWDFHPTRMLSFCKTLRSQGMFEAIRETLETYLRERSNALVLCHLIDAYCDLGQFAQADLLNAQVRKAEPELRQNDNGDTSSSSADRTRRRLMVSSVDIDVGLERYSDASRTIRALVAHYATATKKDVSEQLSHMRLLIASAQISHHRGKFDEAIECWKEALDKARSYSSFTGEGTTYAVIHMSLSLASLNAGEIRAAAAHFELGHSIWLRSTRDYWIPRLDAWVKLVLSKTIEILQTIVRASGCLVY